MNRRSFLKNLFAATATVSFLGAMSKIKMPDFGYASKSEDNGLTWHQEDYSLYKVYEIIFGEFNNTIRCHDVKFDNLVIEFQVDKFQNFKVGDVFSMRISVPPVMEYKSALI